MLQDDKIVSVQKWDGFHIYPVNYNDKFKYNNHLETYFDYKRNCHTILIIAYYVSHAFQHIE